MKDQEARNRLTEIERGVDNLNAQVNCSLRNLVIEECPKCKHKTLNVREDSSSATTDVSMSLGFHFWVGEPDYEYTCLTCGTKWELVEKSVVKKIIK